MKDRFHLQSTDILKIGRHVVSRAWVNLKRLLFVELSQEVHNKMPMLPSEEKMLMTARIL